MGTSRGRVHIYGGRGFGPCSYPSGGLEINKNYHHHHIYIYIEAGGKLLLGTVITDLEIVQGGNPF